MKVLLVGAQVAHSMLCALESIHKAKLVHRDVKVIMPAIRNPVLSSQPNLSDVWHTFKQREGLPFLKSCFPCHTCAACKFLLLRKLLCQDFGLR